MSKIRIKLLDKETNLVVSDRLVESALEFTNGPKEKHDGPVELSVVLESKDKVQGLISYLGQLALDLPITDKPTKRAYNKTTNLAEEQKMDLLEIVSRAKTIEKAVENLRETNYVFLSYEHLKSIIEKNGWDFKLKSDKHENHQFMVRLLKLAKDPKNDQVDISLVFAIKIMGTRFDKIHVYEGGKFSKTLKIEWAERKEIGFKVKEKFFKFPDPMTYEERNKWRQEERRVVNAKKNEKEYTPTTFYTRWAPFITRLQAEPVADEVQVPPAGEENYQIPGDKVKKKKKAAKEEATTRKKKKKKKAK